MAVSAFRSRPHTTASWRRRARRKSRIYGGSNSHPAGGSSPRSAGGAGGSWSRRPGGRTATWRSGKDRRVPSCRSSAGGLGQTSLRARRWTAPGFIGERLVDRLLGRGLLVHQNAVDIRFVQRPVEDSPVPTVQQGDGLPEALKQAGVVERVEDLPVVRMDRVVDDHAPETEVTHHRPRFGKGLRLGAAKAFLDGLGKLLDGDHLRSSTSSGNNWAPVGLIGLPETPRTRPERRFEWQGCVTLIESEFGRTPFKPSRGTDSLEGAFHEAEVRQANRRPGEETLRRSRQRWLRLPHVSRAGCPRSSPSREERRDCERERLDRIFEAGQQPSRTHTAFPSDLWHPRIPTDGAFRFVVGTPVDRAACGSGPSGI